jgi:hypothetical protein
MISFEKFLLMTGGLPDTGRRNKFKAFKSIKKFVLLQFMPEKIFESIREKELRHQKAIFKELAPTATKSLGKLILMLKLDETKAAAAVLEKKFSYIEKYRVLFEQRIRRCEEFLEFSPADKKAFEKKASRYKISCELTITKKSKEKAATGMKAAAVLVGGSATAYFAYKKVMGIVRKKKKEEEK